MSIENGVKTNYVVEAITTKGENSKLCYPIKVTEFSKSYFSGAGVFNYSRKDRLHAGIDFYASVGTPVYAIADGEIINSPYHFYLKAYAIEIQHDISDIFPEYTKPVIIRYGEILGFSESKPIFSEKMKKTLNDNIKSLEKLIEPKIEGKIIKKGQLIGYVGCMEDNGLLEKIKSGTPGGSMLHLELYKGTANGALTVKGNMTYDFLKPKYTYSRRRDLLDPNNIFGQVKLEKYYINK